MPRWRTRTAFIGTGLLVGTMLGCQATSPDGAKPNSAPADGTIYHSQFGNFTCHVPHLLRPGAKEHEGSTADTESVSFSDDYGTLLRIECQRIPPNESDFFNGPKLPQTLDDCFDKGVMPDLFGAVSTNTSILRREHVDTAGGPTLFVVVNIPGGSTLTESDGVHPAKRPDSVRGVMVFVQHQYLFIVMNQEWPMVTEIGHRTVQDRTDALLKDLQTSISGMSFSDGTP